LRIRELLDGFFFDMQFLEKARVTNDPTRYCMNGINVERNDGGVFLIATNGRFMNFVEYEENNAPELSEGFHIIRKCAKDMIILEKDESGVSFPRWRNVIPKENILAVDDVFVNDGKKENDCSFYEFIYILNNLGSCINHKYLEPLAALNVSWDIYLNPYKINSAVMLKNRSRHILSPGKYTTVVMPLAHKCSAGISNALSLLDKTLQSVKEDKESVLFADTIHRKAKPLFEI